MKTPPAPAWYRNWTLHNLVSHPLSEVIFWITGHSGGLAAWVHDITVPPSPERGRQSTPKEKARVEPTAEVGDPDEPPAAGEASPAAPAVTP